MEQHLDRLAVATAMYLARAEYGRLRTMPAPLDPESATESAVRVALDYLERAGAARSFSMNDQQELYELLRSTE